MSDVDKFRNMMGTLTKLHRRILCHRLSVHHLQLILLTLAVIFFCLTFNFITFPSQGKHNIDRSSLSFVRTSGELESIDKLLDDGVENENGDDDRVVKSQEHENVNQRRTRSLYIHSEIKPISTWHELEDLVACVQVEKGKPKTKPCLVQCPNGGDLEIHLETDLRLARAMDAVLFGLSPFTMRWSFPSVLGYKPTPDQLVVFYSMENVLRMHKWNSRLGLLKYHVDMTYGAYSNISVPYAYFVPFTEEETKKSETKNWIEGKTKLIAWMASNCKEVFWPRNEFVTELQRHIHIDTYGRCGNLTCLPRLSEECVKMLTKYKFYLSLENSECNDYLTEKIWASALENNVIPVVYGPRKADYEKYAPPNSFIHVSDFKNAEELAHYIKRVATDEKLYNSYFKWREHGKVFQKYPKLKMTYFCDLLPYIHRVPPVMTEVKDSQWFTSCRHELRVRKELNLTAIQRLSGWEPWK
ncbi:3-galactosyl-N-acetylglucosaminide 4-alpha-L-fucosyltransferase FUT3-like [Lytechinus pictus]|uniref:3-galactosyl-N-acetylglucosaminide 4-alpha-L-fucosyltransferase FUT3-like n=1 Tax=Lytechinus pictus TaxID=7653 RepID=UPI0030BA28A1